VQFTFTIKVEVERSEGKNMSRADVEEALVAELESADPGSLTIEESEYEVNTWDVTAAK
jgi:hypothetical protein